MTTRSVRKGLQLIISTRPGWTADEAANADELLQALRQDRFDVLILDVSLGHRSAIDLLTRIRSEFPSLPVLMLCTHPEEQYAVRCLRAGAQGTIQKDSPAEEILTAIATVAGGDKYITSRLASRLAEEIIHGGAPRAFPRASSSLPPDRPRPHHHRHRQTLNLSVKP
jgi:DNA-binding NarL/FixJ family response regulator